MKSKIFRWRFLKSVLLLDKICINIVKGPVQRESVPSC
jgi:hypothetical protein